MASNCPKQDMFAQPTKILNAAKSDIPLKRKRSLRAVSMRNY
jgi:hypothetical protein